VILLESAALLGLFGLSAFLSASETAITALSLLKMKRLSVAVPRLTEDLADWLAKPHRLLVTILVANNVANIAISSLSATMALPLTRYVRRDVVEVSVWLLASAALMVFGEMVPKIVGRAYRERLSVAALPLLQRVTRFFGFVFSPAHWLMARLAPRAERSPVSKLSALSLEEVGFMLGEYRATGAVPAESGEMLARALALPQRTVAEIRQPADKVDSVALEALEKSPESEELFVDLLVETGRTRVPVTRAGRPVGYVLVMDWLKHRRSGDAVRPQDLVRQARSVPPEMKVIDLLALFSASGEHLAFVGRDVTDFQGLVTLEDALEEIVGEILDEYDVERNRG
jgi:CBS domain containing-hemolysin-like protein